tara:strand:+ start:22474 stop:23292 length:819 start_codon:yes stop_codon:yes gene_type:complete
MTLMDLKSFLRFYNSVVKIITEHINYFSSSPERYFSQVVMKNSIYLGVIIAIGLLVLTLLILFVCRRKKVNVPHEVHFNPENSDQMQLNYYRDNLSTSEIGTFYERYIGYLYEKEGYVVRFHGATNGYDDLGRDLIIESKKEVMIVQAKCWAKYKKIHEKHIFQLFGSMEHYKRTHLNETREVRAVFFTTANYSERTKEIAKVLGVEINFKDVDKNYPLIKCNINQKGDRIYHLPFDPYYDKIMIDLSVGKCYVHTVEEAISKGFRRANRIL